MHRKAKRYRLAIEHYGQARRHIEYAAVEGARNARERFTLANIYDALATCRHNLGRHTEAINALESAGQIWEDLLHENPRDKRSREKLAAAQATLKEWR